MNLLVLKKYPNSSPCLFIRIFRKGNFFVTNFHIICMAELTEFNFFSNSWLWFAYFGLWRISRWSQNWFHFSIKYFLFKPNLFSNMGQTCLWYPFVKVDYVSVDIKIIAVRSVFYHLDAHNLCFYIDLWRTYRAIAFALN